MEAASGVAVAADVEVSPLAATTLLLDLVVGLVSAKIRSVRCLGNGPEDGSGAVTTGGVTSGAVGTVVNVPALWKLPASVTVLA